MATENLRTFKNDVGVTISNTNPAQTNEYVLVTTGSTNQAVIKNLSVVVDDSAAEVAGSYGFPFKVELDGMPIISKEAISQLDLRDGLFAEGHQIIDKNAELKLTLLAESPVIGVPKVDIYAVGNAYAVYRTDKNASDLIGMSTTNVIDYSSLLTSIPIEQEVSTSKTSMYDGAIIYINGTKHYAFIITDQTTVYYYDKNHLYKGNFTFTGAIGSCMTYDGTYLYGKSTNNYTTFYKVKVDDGSFTKSTLETTVNVGTNGTTNDGFLVYYNGFLYHRGVSGYNSFWKINVTNGSTSTLSMSGIDSASENGGARLNCNVYGQPFIIVANDTRVAIYDVVKNRWCDVEVGGGWTLTTTYANQVVGVSAGIVAIYSGSYSNYVFISTNNIDTTTTSTMASSLDISPLFTDSTLISASKITSTHVAFACSDYSSSYSLSPREGTISILVDGVDIQGV